MKRLCWFWLLVFLLTPNVAFAGLIWQFTFGPDATNTLERGTLLLRLGDELPPSPEDVWRNALGFALNIDGEHYRPDSEAPGGIQEWVDKSAPVFDPISDELKYHGGLTGWTGTEVHLFFQDGGKLLAELTNLNDVPMYNQVRVFDGFGNVSLQGVVTSWRVLGVPEPETLSLMMAGLIALAWTRRRVNNRVPVDEIPGWEW